MRLSFLNIFFAAVILFSCTLLVSCDKVDVTFGNLNQNNGPSVTYLQDNKITLQTMQVDSFLTSSKNTFLIGHNNGPEFGTIHAGSYTQFLLPLNPLLNVQHITFDSIVLKIKSKATYYGDTTRPFAIRVYALTEQIQNAALTNNDYYSTSRFNYNATAPLNKYPNDYIIDSPGTASLKNIRLSDTLGANLLNAFITGNSIITSQTNFTNYFPGIYLDVDTTNIKTNTLYGFGDSVIIRLYYDQHGLTTVQKYIDFNYNGAKQFYHIDYEHPLLPSFPTFINNTAVLTSTDTHNKAYLNSGLGTLIKISFPDLANLKALHPFIQVVSAQLVIPPTPGTFIYPYKLPPALTMYETSNTNAFLSTAISPAGAAQNGSLFIDNLYGISTAYTYDITNFITAQLNPPATNSALTPNALLLSPSPIYGDQTLDRLIINDQTLTPGIQLKLYVLGI